MLTLRLRFLIESFGFRIEEAVKKPLVIPLVGTRSAYDVIKAKLDEKNDSSGGKVLAGVIEDVKPSLDVLAAQEILSGTFFQRR